MPPPGSGPGRGFLVGNKLTPFGLSIAIIILAVRVVTACASARQLLFVTCFFIFSKKVVEIKEEKGRILVFVRVGVNFFFLVIKC